MIISLNDQVMTYVKFISPMCSFLKTIIFKMITTKRLSIQGKAGYIFRDMVNINNIDPDLLLINHFDQLCLKLTIVKKIIHHILFLMT